MIYSQTNIVSLLFLSALFGGCFDSLCFLPFCLLELFSEDYFYSIYTPVVATVEKKEEKQNACTIYFLSRMMEF